ncbi:MAG: phosphate/phosphite/phosphonate ABC transporter substrate-binding protein [Fuerstiella sp.]|nr:phosphate/phosphite/phosphonate ABC transporter substrate-binding protein [Fuerstiella sp.]
MDWTEESTNDGAMRRLCARVRFSRLGWWCLVILLSGCSDDVEPNNVKVEVLSATEINRSTSNVLTLGIVPQQAPADIERNWGRLAEYLSQAIGKDVLVKTAPSIPEFEDRCRAGVYDLSYMNPYHYTVFAQDPGYRAMAKQKDKSIIGILVVRKDGDDQVEDDPSEAVLSQFQGEKAAFPSPAAFAASLLTRAEFKKQNVDIDEVYVRTHNSVFEGVANGIFPIGGGVMRTLNSIGPDVKEKLHIYWKSRPHTPHAFAAHPRVTDEDFQKVQTALCSPELYEDPTLKEKILQPIRFKGFVKADDADWDDVRALDLTNLESGLQ